MSTPAMTHPNRVPVTELTTEGAMRRWPRLVSHLIAESLGYFSPEAAANALLAVKRRRENWCEWYIHMAGVGGKSVLQVGDETLRRAIRFRKLHDGYMGSYAVARRIVERRLRTGQGPVFGSWC